jgi:hypothetical protein
MNFLSIVQKKISQLFWYIINLLGYATRRLKFAGRGVLLEDKIGDFLAVFKTTRLFFIFNFLGLIIFTVLPQGTDIILKVIEDLSEFNIWSTVSLLVGLSCWCVFAEFGARYKVYITDNSGHSLTHERVMFRIEAQRFVSAIYLLLPVFIVMLSVIIVSVTNVKSWKAHDYWPFAVLMLLLFLLLTALARFYLDELYVAELRDKKIWYKVRREELKWANKLFGIYNDFVFMVRKRTAFKEVDFVDENGQAAPPPDTDIYNTYRRFTNQIEDLPDSGSTNTLSGFPRNYIKPEEMAPFEFSSVEFRSSNKFFKPNPRYAIGSSEPEFEEKETDSGYYRWIYKNNPRFYVTLHRQVHAIAAISVFFLVWFSTGFFDVAPRVQSPAIVCLAFACWQGIYTWLLYIDKRYRREFKVSVRFILLLWLLGVSFVNADHPVRSNKAGVLAAARPTLTQHFHNWCLHNLAKTESFYAPDYPSVNADSSVAQNDSTVHKVFFITAEGGASRTGAFAALLLAKILEHNPAFRNRVYAYSTVSGGTLGLGLYNALVYLDSTIGNNYPKKYAQLVTDFFKQDQLSPALSKWLYSDLLNALTPYNVELFDRAIALEKSWESSYGKLFNSSGDVNVFGTNFLTAYYPNKKETAVLPAWFINTTEAETGRQCYISNVTAPQLVFGADRDLLKIKIPYGINYSTAIGFSTRFPLFSPSAAVKQADNQMLHYIDGGYIENTGSKTLHEIITALRPQLIQKRIAPYVIQIRYSNGSSQKPNLGFLNEISSVAMGIASNRTGNADLYSHLLQQTVSELHGEVIPFSLAASANEVPMNWVFSNRSINNLNLVVDSLFRDTNKMNKIFEK